MIVDYSKFDSDIFLSSLPFPHVVIDNLFDESFLREVEKLYPKKEDVKWWKYSNHFEKKLAFNQIDILPSCLQDFFNTVNSQKFVKHLESLTSIKSLIDNPTLLSLPSSMLKLLAKIKRITSITCKILSHNTNIHGACYFFVPNSLPILPLESKYFFLQDKQHQSLNFFPGISFR